MGSMRLSNWIFWRVLHRPLVALLFLSLNIFTAADPTGNFLNITNANLPNPVLMFPTDVCAVDPCKNGAHCIPNANSEVTFTCQCLSGWTGQFCDMDIDECADPTLNKCQNNALCQNLPGRFQCYCIPGYLGEYCEMEANECLADPCRNGATCTDKLNGYQCTCPPGYTGKQCETDINECQPNPCQNGALCTDLPAAYNCSCQLGFRGKNCEINIDNCEEKPCLNGGRCVDEVNNFTCNCLDTGFAGRFCELEVDDCAASPCQHNGTCTDIGRDYKCRCFEGYLGKNCEVDIDECQEPFPPCKNNATCHERSKIVSGIDRNLFGLSPAFSYANSAGYICMCPPGFTGRNCETEVDECASAPCVHGSCLDFVNGYRCTCFEGWTGTQCQQDIDECAVGVAGANSGNGSVLVEPVCDAQHGRCHNTPGNYSCGCDSGYAGRNCSILLTGCQEETCPENTTCPSFTRCAEGSTCQPFLSAEYPWPVQNFSCLCQSGRAGRYCQHSSVASFALDGYLQLLNQSLLNVAFDFRTTLNDSVLLVAFEQTLIVALQINGGQLQVLVHDPLEPRTTTLNANVSDGTWYAANLTLSSQLITASVRPTGAKEEQTQLVKIQVADLEPEHLVFNEVFFGGIEHRLRFTGTSFRSNMIGCMRDIRINEEVLVPVELNSSTRRRAPSVRSVCDRKEQCSANSCNRRGRCSDLWNHYECACQRPFYGLSCEKEIPAGTFGHENSSSMVVVTLNTEDQASLALRNELSFRIRTRQNDSTVLYLGSSDGVSSFLTLNIINGRLVLAVKLGDVMEQHVNGPAMLINDGVDHYVDIRRQQTMLEVTVDNGIPVFAQLASASPLKAQVLLVGQAMASSQSKTRLMKRQTEDPNDVIVKEVPDFKGVIQDLRLNGKLVAFFGEATTASDLQGLPTTFGNVTASNVLKGVVSDNSCASTPCHNAGTCHVTWNDYRCNCPVAFRGKSCGLPNFCLSNECPSPHAQCRKLENDYECLVQTSFLSPENYITYRPSTTSMISAFRKVSLKLRTRVSEARNILSLMSSRHELKIYIKTSRIQIEYGLSAAAAPSVVTIDYPINDAVWHTFEAEFLDRALNIVIDGRSFSQDIALSEVPLNAILLEDNAYVQVAGGFIGCMDDVRLGTHLLPVFPESAARAAIGLRRIVKLEKVVGVEYGCQGQDMCRQLPCAFGQCIDVWNERHCECDPAKDGLECTMASERSRLNSLPFASDCQGPQCLNGGTLVCNSHMNGTNNITVGSCVCPPDHDGPLCEIVMPVVAELPQNQLAIILGVTLSIAGLLVLIALTAFCMVARRKRAERGTYSPNRQENFGRVEMDYVLKPPPKEALI